MSTYLRLGVLVESTELRLGVTDEYRVMTGSYR